MLVASAPAAAAPSCPAPRRAAELTETLDGALGAYADLDLDAFALRVDQVDIVLPCLGDVVEPRLAAHYHRIDALRLHTAGTEGDALDAALLAARAVAPEFAFDDATLPPNDAFRHRYDAVEVDRQRTRTAPAPREVTLVFDGVPTRERPIDRATLVQVLDPAGAVLQTVHLLPGDPLPPYETIPRLRRRLTASAGVEAGIAAALLGTSVVLASGFHEPGRDVDLDQLARERAAINALFWSSVGFGAAASGTTVGAIAVGRR